MVREVEGAERGAGTAAAAAGQHLQPSGAAGAWWQPERAAARLRGAAGAFAAGAESRRRRGEAIATRRNAGYRGRWRKSDGATLAKPRGGRMSEQ